MGQGLPVPAPAMMPWDNLFDLPPWTGDDRAPQLAQDWYLDGLSPPAPVQIPFSWLTGPIRMRQIKPFTYATVSKNGGSTAVVTVAADEQTDYTATTYADNNIDAPNLAHFVTTYYDAPAIRLPQLRFVLNKRAPTEIWTLLGVGIGDRIQLTGTPSGWPTGAADLVVEGIRHSSRQVRLLEWSASPVVGATAGSVGPFFRVGVSTLGGTDLLPW